MTRRGYRFSPVILSLLSIFAAGCNRSDVEVLTRVGAKLADRAENLVEKSPKLRSPLQVKPTARDRVMQRLQNDKVLSAHTIEVVETERGVRLLGTLPDEETKAMVLDLVRNTMGIEEVEDGLEVEE